MFEMVFLENGLRVREIGVFREIDIGDRCFLFGSVISVILLRFLGIKKTLRRKSELKLLICINILSININILVQNVLAELCREFLRFWIVGLKVGRCLMRKFIILLRIKNGLRGIFHRILSLNIWLKLEAGFIR